MYSLKNKKVIITGASFIGSHLVPELIKEKVGSIIIINLSNKHKYLFDEYSNYIEFVTQDLRNSEYTLKKIKNADLVFHLAADHGGRGYIEDNAGSLSTNFLLDSSVFFACLKNGIGKIFFSSSACVYPDSLQNNLKKNIKLKEDMIGPPYEADSIYGWAKLMGEFTLRNYFNQFGLESVIARLFTVYGENAGESHAIMSTIGKVQRKQDPFEIWGDGKQIRNWIYVKDICKGIILSVKKLGEAQVINLGSEKPITVDQMVNKVFEISRYHPKTIKYLDMPTGPLNRVADNKLAYKLLNWQPRISFDNGLKRTIIWYRKKVSLNNY